MKTGLLVVGFILIYNLCLVAGDKIKIYWTPNRPEDGICEYRIYHGTNIRGPFKLIASTDQTNYIMLSSNKNLNVFFVTAVNSNGIASADIP